MKLLTIILISIFFSCSQKQEENRDNLQPPLDRLKTGNEKFIGGHPIPMRRPKTKNLTETIFKI